MAAIAPFIAIAATVASTGVAVYSQYRQQQASEAGAETQRRLDEERAVALGRQATQERVNAGQQRAVAQRRAEERQDEARRLVAKQNARFAASGGGTEGSAAAIMGETVKQGDYNAELELWQGKEKGRAHLANAYDADTQATITRAGANARVEAAKNARGGTYLNMAGTILSGVGKVAGQMPAGGGSDGGTARIAYDHDEPSGWRTSTYRNVPEYEFG